MRSYAEGDEPVPGYQITRFLGAGGYGTVWVAKSPGDVEIALKIINLQGQGLKEFRAVGIVKKLRHPNLIPIYAYWLKDEQGWFLLKNLAGIEWSAQFCADPKKVDALRQNAKRLYAKFPLTAAAFKAMGFDHVRFTLNCEPMFRRGQADRIPAEYLAMVDGAVKMILDHNLNVIIDIHPESDFKQKLSNDDSFVEQFEDYWRALAKQLVGKIPFGGGLIAKAAVAYAGTKVLGLSLDHFYSLGRDGLIEACLIEQFNPTENCRNRSPKFMRDHRQKLVPAFCGLFGLMR